MRRLRWLFLLLLSSATLAQSSPDKPVVVEYYYKTKWGHADEFLRLFKKNHYPLLKKEVEMGRMLKVWMDQPRYHTTEDGRWDYRVRKPTSARSSGASRFSTRTGICHSRLWIWKHVILNHRE